MSRPLAAVLTLGCKLNSADSDEIAYGLRAAGFDVVDSLCEADAYVVNTCSVTHVADAKSRKLIRAVRRLSPAGTVAVTGCFPQSAGFEAARQLGADFVCGTRDTDKADLVRFIQAACASAMPAPPAASSLGRAFIKAQEGCNDVCSFCIVPRTRGREESRSIDHVAREVDRAVADGAREVVITGTQLGAWGRDFAEPLKPHHLVAGLLERCEVPRIRFSSLQPQDITPELLGLWSDPRLMPHFHLALQSGSDATLSAMRRKYTAREFVLAAERIKAAVPGVAVTTDVIAGFPGESEADFQATLDLCREAGFSRLHGFPYSQRDRTGAARLPGHLSAEVKKERMLHFAALSAELTSAFHARHSGTVRPVLWERALSPQAANVAPGLPENSFAEDAQTWHGYTDNYIPVYANARNLRHRVTPVQLGGVYDDGLWGIAPWEAL